MTPVAGAVADALRPFAADDRGIGSDTTPCGALLAVSGGRDSMVLLHAAMLESRAAVRAVATFDHGTGPHASAAVARVCETARALGVEVIAGEAARAGRTEAEWREARWHFLWSTAAAVGAVAIATAHTRDDQVETVVIRALRAAGARGLAAMRAPDPSLAIVRPLLAVGRADVAAYAAAHAIGWDVDPSNGDRRHLRARLRADLLPAVTRVRPQAAARLVAVAADAARWRAGVDAWSERLPAKLPVAALAACDPESLAVFWPARAARAGVRLDRRAVARLVAYTRAAVARVRDGTVQRCRIPIARGALDLEYSRDPGRRGWHFTVGRAVGVAGPVSSDYA